MLKYTVKPSKETELRDFPIRDFYVAPNLLYISGVTDYNVGLVNGEQVIIKSPYLIGSEVNTVNVVDTRRQGKLGITITLPVKKVEKYLKFDIYNDNDGRGNYILAYNTKQYIGDVSSDTVYSSVTQNYVEYRGDICYFFRGNVNGYLVDHKFYNASVDDETIDIETFVYIDDGEIHIGDEVYFADFTNVTNDGDAKPEIRLSKYVEPISGGTFLGYIEGNTCSAMSSDDNSLVVRSYKPKDWERVSKFYIIKNSNPTIYPEDVLYGGFNHYVTYRDENYYLQNVDIDDENKGYGVIIDENFYEVTNNYGFETEHHDNQYAGSSVYINETDEYITVEDTLASFNDGGWLVLLIDIEMNSDVRDGNYIIAESNAPISIRCGVIMDEHPYIEYLGEKYYIQDHLCDTVTMSGKEYRLVYLNDDFSSAGTIINGEVVYFTIKDNKASLDANIYYQDKSSVEAIKVKYGINEDAYDVTNISGVTINGLRYPVELDASYGLTDEDTGDIVREEYGVTIDDYVKIPLYVLDINGSSTYVCYPVVDDELFDEIEAYSIMRELTSIIVDNWKVFSFMLRKDTFGSKEFTVDNGLMASMSAEKPYTMSDAYLLENRINILRLRNYLSLKFPMSNKSANNIRREDTIKNDFVDYVRKEATNRIVDMEKDVYYPVWKSIENGETYYRPIEQIRFNLHFRTRNLDNWKIIEDDREYISDRTYNSERCNWFVLDHKYYRELMEEEDNVAETHLHNSSDLLGYLNFTTEDIRNQSSKLAKSFLRLSFYSTSNPNTQVLLSTSTIFFDENYAYKRYMDSKRNSYLVYVDTESFEVSSFSSVTDYIASASTSEYQVTSNTISNFSEVWDINNNHGDFYLNDDTRLSSRFIIENKYNTDTSSEGYYFYMFKEYSRKMREATVYLKVEFNHAGIGKTIPFMLPRITRENNEIGTPLYVHNNEDLNTLRNGFRMVDMYNQVYIPIRLIYDDKENRYVYFLPDELRENDELGVPNEVMEFNLFEVKFANEAIIRTNVQHSNVRPNHAPVEQQTEERWIRTSNSECDEGFKYSIEIKQNKINGIWTNTNERRLSEQPIGVCDETSSNIQYQWVEDGEICYGSNRYEKLIKKYLGDDGIWHDTGLSKRGDFISSDCEPIEESGEGPGTGGSGVGGNDNPGNGGGDNPGIGEDPGTGGGEDPGTGGGGNNTPTVPITIADNEILYKADAILSERNGFKPDAFSGGGQQLSITSHTFSNCVGRIKFDGIVRTIGVEAFFRCTNLYVLVIPKDVNYLDHSAFYGCGQMEGIVIKHEHAHEINVEVFDLTNNCPIYVPTNSVEEFKNAPGWNHYENRIVGINTMPSDLMSECNPLDNRNKTITYKASSILPEISNDYPAADQEPGLHIGRFGSSTVVSHTFKNGSGTINFSDDVTIIGAKAFYECTGMTRIVLPTNVTTIYRGAFDGCTNLMEIVVSSGLTSIGQDAFRYCGNLLTIEIPSGVTLINDSTFASCSSLRVAYIRGNVTEIKEHAFQNCTQLVGVGSSADAAILPNSVVTIKEKAFNGCSELLELFATVSTETIGISAFENCTKLRRVYLGNNISDIGDYAFYRCGSLNAVRITATTPPALGRDVFTDCNENLKIYVPSNSVIAYRDAWREQIDNVNKIQPIP